VDILRSSSLNVLQTYNGRRLLDARIVDVILISSCGLPPKDPDERVPIAAFRRSDVNPFWIDIVVRHHLPASVAKPRDTATRGIPTVDVEVDVAAPATSIRSMPSIFPPWLSTPRQFPRSPLELLCKRQRHRVASSPARFWVFG